MILATAEGFGMDDDLVLTIGQGLAVVTLDDGMGSPHFGRVVIRNVAADLLSYGPILSLVLLEPPLKALSLPLEALYLLLSQGLGQDLWAPGS